MAEEWIAVKAPDGVMARVTTQAFDVLYEALGYQKIDEQELVDFESQVVAAQVVSEDQPVVAPAKNAPAARAAVTPPPAPNAQGS